MHFPPVKNLLSRVQEPPDPIIRMQVGLDVEGHVPSPSLVSLTLAILLFKVKIKLICHLPARDCPTVDFH